MTLETIAGDDACCQNTLHHQGMLVAMVGGGMIGPDHQAGGTHAIDVLQSPCFVVCQWNKDPILRLDGNLAPIDTECPTIQRPLFHGIL